MRAIIITIGALIVIGAIYYFLVYRKNQASLISALNTSTPNGLNTTLQAIPGILTITSAYYGANSSWIDVTKDLSGYISGSSINLKNNGSGLWMNDLFSKDPAPNQVKKLNVKWSLNTGGVIRNGFDQFNTNDDIKINI